MNNSLIILGAGASFESGIPIQHNFVSEALKIADISSNYRYSQFYPNLIRKFQRHYQHTNNIEIIYK